MTHQYSIEIEGLSVSYEKKRILTAIYANIEPGSVVGVVGPNGAGKSTLFKAILGLIEVNGGTVRVDGKSIDDVRKNIAYVPQKDNVDWDFPATVKDIVLMGRYPHKSIVQRLSREDHRIAREALQSVGISDLATRQIGELSGGQQQRVFIARALCQQADFFLLDEPFVGVDITTESKIVQILQDLAAQKKTMMVVHHDLASVSQYFDKVMLLNQRLIAFGDTAEIFTQENIAKTYGPQLNILHKAAIR